MTSKRRLIIFLFGLLSFSAIKAQPCDDLANDLIWEFQTSLPTINADCEKFFVEVVVSGFTDIAAFQYTISFNPNVLQLDSLSEIGSPLTGPVGANTTDAENGNIGVLWSNINGEGESLPDGSGIFKLWFKSIGEPGEVTDFMITSNLTDLEIYWLLPGDVECIEDEEANPLTIPIELECNTVFATTEFCATGNNLGALTISVCGGVAPYTWSFEGTSTETGNIANANEVVVISDIGPNLYLLSVMDSNGTIFEEFIEINTIDFLTVEADVLQAPACDGFNGDVIAVGSGGDGEYFYSWSNGFFNIDILDGVPEGMYTVTVTDGQGCTASSSILLNTDPLMLTVDTTSATCLGALDGAAIVTATGGTPFPGNEYSFDGLNGTIGDFQFLDPDDYSVTVSDASNCTAAIDWVIESILVPETELILIEPIECGGEGAVVAIDGNITNQAIIVSTDDQGNFYPGAAGPDGVFTFIDPLLPGLYNITYTTMDGCGVDYDFEIIGPPEIEITLDNVEEPGCEGGPGSISITAVGGTGTLSYEWNEGSESADLVNLTGGLYSLTVTDSNLCTDTISVMLNNAGTLNIMAFVETEVGCGAGAETGAVDVDVQGAGTNIEYNWEDESGTVVGTTSLVVGLSTGTYTVTVTDVDAGCSNTAQASISGAGNFFFDPTIINPPCAFLPEGSIEMSIIGGTPNFEYSWSHDDELTFNLASSLVPGFYSVTVSDGNGCDRDTTIEITSPDPIIINIESFQAVSCFDGNDGMATVTASGSSAGVPEYEFTWFDADDMEIASMDVSESTLDNLEAGIYSVQAFDGVCVSEPVFIEILNGEAIMIDDVNSQIQGPTCTDDVDGMIAIEAIGGSGTGGYEYDWSTNEMGNTISDLAAGIYTVTITDDLGCEISYDIELLNPEPLSLVLDEIQTIEVSCNAPDSGVIATTAIGGTGTDFTYVWTPDVSDTSIANEVEPGMYTVVVTDEAGCSASLTYEVEAYIPIEAEILPFAELNCPGEKTLFCVGEHSGGTGFGYTYQLDFGNVIPIDSCLLINAGNHSLVVFDSEGCRIEDQIEFDVLQPDPISIELQELYTLQLGDTTLVIEAILNSTTGIDSVEWVTDNLDWECDNADCSNILVSVTENTNFNVIVTDDNGCTAQAQTFVEIEKIRNIFFPSIFTPDADGNNDTFYPFAGAGIERINYFHIYDRWGNLMHSAEDIKPGEESLNDWDGKYNGTPVQPGVYVFIAEVLFVDDFVEEFKGSVTLHK